jgi:hypothetical protein
MDHLREYVKEWIEFTRENSSSAAKMDDDELFDVVMENVVSVVEDYNFVDYSKALEKED